MKKTALAVVAVFFMAVLSGYAGTKPRIAPPPPRVDVVPDSPTPYHVWIAGYWKWAGINYVWVEGRWVKPKPGKAWVPGKWVKKGSYWAWTAGRWQKVKTDKPKPAKKKEPKAPKKK
jgi:hypothetical protein